MSVQALEKDALRKKLAEFDRSFLDYVNSPEAEVIRELPPAVTYDQAFLAQLNGNVDRLNWLSEGPDSYDTVDDTISSTQESRYDWSPYILWSVNILNNAASGGPNLLVRFTDSYGRVKQYKLVPGADFSLKEMKGSMGSVYHVIADSASAEMIAFVTLRWPYQNARPL